MPVPTGVVGLIVNGSGISQNATLDAGGNFTINVPSLPVGTDTLVGNYGGDANSDASQSVPVSEQVNPLPQPQPTTTVITNVTPNPALAGQPVTVTGTVSYS